MFCWRTFGICFIIVSSAKGQVATVTHQAGTLSPRSAIERELGPGQTDIFTVEVAVGQFLHVLVEKKGVDAEVVLIDPAGKTIVTADSPNGAFGPNPASLIAERDGSYEIRISKAPRTSETGKYRIELQELRAPNDADRQRLQAEMEFFAAVIGDRSQDKDKRQGAIAGYQRAASIWHSLQDAGEEALCLHRAGFISRGLGAKQKALDYYNQALPLERAVGDRAGEATTLNNIGTVYNDLGEKQRALDYYNQALPLRRAVGDHAGEAATLGNIGNVYNTLGEKQKALDYYNEVLPLLRAVGSHVGEATALQNIGVAYRALGEMQKALDNSSQALSLWRAMGDRAGEAETLNNIGFVYSDLGEMQEALDYYNQALPLKRAVGDRAGEAGTLQNIGTVYSDLGQKQKALDCYSQAIPLERAVGDRAGEAKTLNNIGNVYTDLGENQKALDYYSRAIPLERAVGDRAGEAITLNNIGAVYTNLKENQKALDYFSQTLSLWRAMGDRAHEGETLNNIGIVYSILGEKQKALEYFNQALLLHRATGDRGGEAKTLNNIGNVYRDLGEKQKALDYYNRALPLRCAVGDRAGEATTLGDLMQVWEDRSSGLATFFGKEAVNLYQGLRRDIRGLDQEVQRTYLASVSENYRHLADLLIAHGRLSEAEQVLSLLKQQEYFDYVRRDEVEASSVDGRANLTSEEAEAERRYQEIEDRLVAVGVERGDLIAKKSLTVDEKQRLDVLEKDIATGNVEFEKFLGDLARQFAAKPAMALHIEQLRETQGIMEDLRELPKGTVAIFTLAGEDRFRSILRTPDVQKAYEYPIKGADLNRKVLDFREAVQDPKLDPRPAAEDLFKIIIGPMAKDLRAAKARTLMWSLDGVLRYLPLAALYDGKHYLIEQYRVSVMTLASESRMKDAPDATWHAAGFGVTKAYQDEPALPSVKSELAGIISTRPGDAGVLAGEIKIDDEFTRDAMRQTLLKRYPVVHIATHFRFMPGNETQSFLLLGDGARLSMAELKTSANLFGGVQLLTLSACNTGIGDGTEVEGFGTLAQRQGAKAVIATLWPVADESTSLMMQEFYRIRESAPGMTKLEALRQAQLELLRGKLRTTESAGQGVAKHETAPRSVASAVDPKTPFAHPYYWAPFFLMGNWL